MPVRGLTIIVVEASTARFHAALSIAAASAATGAATRLHLHGEAVRLIAPLVVAAEDARHAAAGLPKLDEVLEESLALGVAVTACQSGLAMNGIDATTLDGRIETEGLVSVMAHLGHDRLVVI